MVVVARECLASWAHCCIAHILQSPKPSHLFLVRVRAETPHSLSCAPSVSSVLIHWAAIPRNVHLVSSQNLRRVNDGILPEQKKTILTPIEISLTRWWPCARVYGSVHKCDVTTAPPIQHLQLLYINNCWSRASTTVQAFHYLKTAPLLCILDDF